MKQKIGIIQALMVKPPIVILDEPTAGLDPLMVQAFRETLADLKREGHTTVFLSSHVLTEVESTCDRIGLVRGGQMVASSTMDEIRRNARRKVTVTFGDGGGKQAFDVAGPLGPLLASLNGRPVQDIEVEPFRLEDYIAQFYAGARR
jgi:ABC-2 type transport system ATP-binding protein